MEVDMFISESKHKYSLNLAKLKPAQKQSVQKEAEIMNFLINSLARIIADPTDKKSSPNFGIELNDISVKENLKHERVIQIKLTEDIEIAKELLGAIRRILSKLSEGNDVSIFDYGDWYNVSEAANKLGVTRPTVYKMIEDGRIKAVDDKNGKKISPKSVIAYLEKQELDKSEALAMMAIIDAKLDQTDELDEGVLDGSGRFEEVDL